MGWRLNLAFFKIQNKIKGTVLNNLNFNQYLSYIAYHVSGQSNPLIQSHQQANTIQRIAKIIDNKTLVLLTIMSLKERKILKMQWALSLSGHHGQYWTSEWMHANCSILSFVTQLSLQLRPTSSIDSPALPSTVGAARTQRRRAQQRRQWQKRELSGRTWSRAGPGREWSRRWADQGVPSCAAVDNLEGAPRAK